MFSSHLWHAGKQYWGFIKGKKKWTDLIRTDVVKSEKEENYNKYVIVVKVPSGAIFNGEPSIVEA
jgi:hypothetical protein